MKPNTESVYTHPTFVIARFMRATKFVLYNEEKLVARTSRAMTMIGSLKTKVVPVLVISFAFALSGCGVKSDLVLPDGKPSPKGEKDPSKPPSQQQGR
jgi:predicted small lipoprotein YifL